MRWIPTPTDAYSDVRLAEAGEKAEILHRRAWDWCGHHETDGVIPESMLARLCPVGWKARLRALLAVGMWVEVDGGYQLAAWVGVLDEMRSLQRRRESDVERSRRYRAAHPNRVSSRDENADASRDETRESPLAEETRENTPLTPRQAGGTNCDPETRPHSNCRGCRTTPRLMAADLAAANAAAAAAELDDLVRRRADIEWCGDYECSRQSRRRITENGSSVPCRQCHPDVVAGPLPTPARPLAVVGAR